MLLHDGDVYTFPYGAFTTMTLSSDTLGFLLIAIQFPLYAVIIVLVKGARWRVIALLLVVASHVLAASLALHDYCRWRRRCAVEPVPSLLIEARNPRGSSYEQLNERYRFE